MASLTPDQLAAATAVDDSKPAQSLVCFDPPRGLRSAAEGGSANGASPILNAGRVYTHDGLSLRGRSRSSLFLLATPIMIALGVASEEKMAELMTPPKENYDKAERTNILMRLASCCKDQSSYHLACKK